MVLATALWGVMFSPLTAPHVPFWGMMSLAAGVLSVLAFAACPELRREHWRVADLYLGAGIAAGLWGVFWAGDQISSLLFDFARPQVDSIYNMKEGTPAWLLSALLLLWIGPAEELFWRGYVQRRLTQRWCMRRRATSCWSWRQAWRAWCGEGFTAFSHSGWGHSWYPTPCGTLPCSYGFPSVSLPEKITRTANCFQLLPAC